MFTITGHMLYGDKWPAMLNDDIPSIARPNNSNLASPTELEMTPEHVSKPQNPQGQLWNPSLYCLCVIDKSGLIQGWHRPAQVGI